MKEQTYGWYPPARSIWDRSKELTTYHKECLYKHRNSRYNTSPIIPTPALSKPLMQPRKPSRPSSQISMRQQGLSQKPGQLDLSITGSRPPSVCSVGEVTSSKPYKQKKTLQNPRKVWSTQLNSTSTSLPQYMTAPGNHELTGTNRISIDHSPLSSASCQRFPPSHATQMGLELGVKRAQSAPPPHHIMCHPSRPTKSAGSQRSSATCAETVSDEVLQRGDSQIKNITQEKNAGSRTSTTHSEAETCPSMPRPDAPVPESDEEDEQEEGEEEEYAEGSQTEDEQLDYEEQLAKYGWRFEVPGDPFCLKKPTLPPRHPYTTKVTVPKVAPNPPTGHMMNYDTYFYNTIPRKPMSFTVHKEWISEVLHAKRLDLQKKVGVNYNFKQFAFIY